MNNKILKTSIKYSLVFVLLLVFATPGLCSTFDWVGNTATWSTGNNWKVGGTTQAAPPTAADDVRIGVNGFTNQPTVTGTTTVKSITFGDNNGTAMTLTVNTGITLTVTTSIIQNHNNSNNGITTTITGAGTATIICASFTVGDGTAPPVPNGDALFGGNLPTNNATIINCSIPTLTINGNLTLHSTSSALATWTVFFFSVATNYSVNNPQFNLNSGTVTANNIITTNSAYVSKNDGTYNVFNTCAYKMDIGATANTLKLLGATPLTVATGGTVDFVSGGTVAVSTVNYAATGGTQTIYTSANAALNNTPTVYPNLTLSGAGAKTADGSLLTIGGSWNTSGGAVNLNTNSPDVTVAGSWTNSATITQGSGDISITGAVTNSAGGTLTLGTGDLTISGSYTNNGTYTASTGNTIFDGASPTLIDGGLGTMFNKVSFSGSGTALLSSGNFSVSSAGVLTMANTNILNANGHLTLNSAAASSATIATIPATCSITGSVSVQRYLTGGTLTYRGYRFLSSPVNAGGGVYSINYLKNSTFLTGTTGAAGGFDQGVNPTLYLYRDNLTPAYTTFLNSNFIGISNITTAPTYSMNDATYTTITIPEGNGFLCFFRGSRATVNPYLTNTIPIAATLTATGTLNQGLITVKDWFIGTPNLSYTAASPVAVRGFNLVGNPYASSIDWDNLGTSITSTSLSPFIYILNPTSKNYRIYQSGHGGIATDGTTSSNIIPSGQGFFVVATAASPALVFTELAKTTLQPPTLNIYMGTPVDYANNQYIRVQLAKDSVNSDDMLIRFSNNASAAYNASVDAPYKQGFGEVSLASLSSDHIPLAISMQPLPKVSESIRLSVSTTDDGAYSLSMKTLIGIPQLFDIWLMDAYKKDSLDMRHNTTYAFNVLKGDTNSFGSKRFSLVLRQNPAYAYHLLNFTAAKAATASASGRQVQVVWTTENEQNYTNFTVERSTDGGKTFDVIGGVTASALGTYSLMDKNPAGGQNLYRLKQEDINNTISYSAIIPVEYARPGDNLAKNGLNIFPNPASSTINLAIATDANSPASYNILITNSSGLVIKQATSAQPTWQTSVSNLLPGTYIVKVLNTRDQTLIGNTKFVKL
ncbi:MAG: hypothetical protein JWP37_2785 [Mucilaginibacter sp.]|nr:hypothetical protein [Mucilaginibacter sp.]